MTAVQNLDLHGMFMSHESVPTAALCSTYQLYIRMIAQYKYFRHLPFHVALCLLIMFALHEAGLSTLSWLGHIPNIG